MWTRLLAPARIRTLLTGTVIAVAVVTVAGFAVLWPRGPAPALRGAAPLRYLDATVTSVHQGPCQDLDAGGRTTCQLADATLRSGPDRGTTVSFRLFGTDFSAPTLHADDKVVLIETPSTAPTAATRSPTSSGDRRCCCWSPWSSSRSGAGTGFEPSPASPS
jgi:hypothetical protein